MSAKANGTHAKDVALHFVNVCTDGRVTPSFMGKTTNQAKSLLNSGFTKEEIIAVIDKIMEQGVHMFSLGYVNACITDVIKEVQKDVLKAQAEKVKEEIATTAAQERNEVSVDGESAERNRNKTSRFGIQSGFGKKHHFDMFEGN